MNNHSGLDGYIFIGSFVLQVLTLVMLILKTSFMLTRFGDSIPSVITSHENAFLGLGILFLSISLFCCGVLYYRHKNKPNTGTSSSVAKEITKASNDSVNFAVGPSKSH